MKTIGIIGGMSWQSSVEYYKIINKHVEKLMGESHSGKIILYSVNFFEIAKLSHENNWNAISEKMKVAAMALEQAGADVILLATNTIHKVSQYISSSVQIPFLHIAESTGRSITNMKLKKVGLIGTKYTMEFNFYTKFLQENFNIHVVIPNSIDRQNLHSLIYNELVKGRFTDNAKDTCINIIKRLKRTDEIEGIILGCTELPILIPENEIPMPSFNTTHIHALDAVHFALYK